MVQLAPRATARDTHLAWNMMRLAILATGALGFGFLVILNAGGYRYAVSDQAFYIPVILQRLTGDLYPHDAVLLAAQDRFFLFDDWFAPILKVTGASVPLSFLTAYAATLILLFLAIVHIGRTLYTSWWTVAGVVIGLTMRHRIADTAVNSLEGYFHPRLLAFAVGLWAVAAFLRGRTWIALLVTILALLVHPTTGLWFAIWVGTAALVADRKARPWLVGLASTSVVTAVWVVMGPLGGQLVVMDPTWLSVLAVKDYLFPTEWPTLTWVGNLAMATLIAAIYRYRRLVGVTSPEEGGLVVGCAMLLGLFLLSVPLSEARIALVVQLQFSRVFWLFDVFGTCYVAWLLIEGPVSSRSSFGWLRTTPRPAVVAIVLVLAIARGGYVTLVEHAGQPIVQPRLEAGDWTEVMEWASRQPVGTHFLADPAHARRYGTSVRAASGRDVYLEVVKDTGMAIYSADIAHRVSERIENLGNFETLDAKRAVALAERHALDFLITEHKLDLPEARRTGRFYVYDLGGDDQLATRPTVHPATGLRDN